MQLSHLWLKTLLPHDRSPEEVARELTFRACPVEGIEPLAGGDARLGLEVTFNRPDLLSHVGVARELAAVLGGSVRAPDPRPAGDPGSPVSAQASVTVEAADACPRYTARVIRGVKVGPSPAWLAARLEALGLRPVNNVVDVTNYVLMELGQPLHAFDLATLAGRRVVVRRARPAEPFTAIDGTLHKLTPETLVIADGERPVAMAGIMGGKDTEIGAGTQDVLLESAYFDPVTVRRAVRRHNLRSDSSYRFERGVDPLGVDLASRRACELILETAGGTLCEGVLDVDAGTLPGPRHVRLRHARLEKLAGCPVPEADAVRVLRSLGMEVTALDAPEGRALDVVVPTARHEVSREVDLIEEVLRTWGYDRVPENPVFPVRVARTPPRERAIERVKSLLVGAGFREVLSLTFVEKDDDVDPPFFASGPSYTVKNPVQPEIPALRRSLFGPLLTAKKINAEKGNRRVRLFEVSAVHLPVPDDAPRERLHVGFIADAAFLDVKGVLEALLADLGLPIGGATRLAEASERGLDALQQCAVHLADAGAKDGLGAKVGVLGLVAAPQGRALSPRAKDLYDAAKGAGKGAPGAVVCLLDLDALVEAALARGSLERRHVPPPSLPPVTRDLAVVVDGHRAWREIEAIIAATEVPHLARFAYIQGSVFAGAEGKAVPAGKTSIALTLEFRAKDRTLTGEEADAGRERVKAALVAGLGASFRE